MKFRISRLADRDIEDIWQFIARDNPNAADRVEEELHEAMQMLATHPGAGHTRTDVSDPRYRFWSVYSYLIGYRLDGESIVVVRAIHGSRDVRQILGR